MTVVRWPSGRSFGDWPSWADDLVSRRSRAVARQRAYRRRLAVNGDISSGGARICMNAMGDVHVTAGGEGVRHKGVSRCGSPWSCPSCAPTIRRRRADEISSAAEQWVLRGGRLLFATFTLPHHSADDLKPLLRAVMDGYGRVWAGRAAMDWKAANGLEFDRECERCHGFGRVGALSVGAGYADRSPSTLRDRDVCGVCEGSGVDSRPLVGQVRAIEVTDGVGGPGDAGWHPHVHALLFVGPEVSAAAAKGWLLPRWSDAVFGELGRRVSGRWGVDVRDVGDRDGMADYLAKVEGGWGAAAELTRTDLKSGSSAARRSPAEMLEAAADGDPRAHQRWVEYEDATSAARCVQWSGNLLRRLGLKDAVTDQEAAAERAGSKGPTSTIVVPRDQWNRDVRNGTEWRHRHIAMDRWQAGLFDEVPAHDTGPAPPALSIDQERARQVIVG